MRRTRGNKLSLGIVDGKGVSLEMTARMRSRHLYICGSTGTGKSKMLEHLIRQDIKNWPQSKCGALILDPHGSLYTSLIQWIAWNAPYLKDVPIVPVDLRQNDWTIGYNVLRQREVADPAVVISTFVQAMSYVWGVDGTQSTPLFARLAKEVLWALYEKKMTLNEVKYLIDRTNKRLRTSLTEGLTKDSVAQGWQFSNSLSSRDFNLQFSSTVNRFYSFLDVDKLRLMFGQDRASLDLGRAIEEGQIIIVNLSTQRGRIADEDAALFATLLLSDLWTAAKERGKGTEEDDLKPFYLYADEFHNFITPTIAKNLDQARGFGLHLTLANQFPRQILHAGANGPQVYDSVMANARSKIVFSLEGEENLKPLAQSLFMGVINPDEIKHSIFSRKIMDYAEETRTVYSTSENWSNATGDFTGATETESASGAVTDGAQQEQNIWNTSGANSTGTSHMRMKGEACGESTVPFLRPIFGQELSSVQFRSVEEQLFKGMVSLFDQQDRHGVVRLVGMRAPLNIVTPTVKKMATTEKMTASFLERRYSELPFAIRGAEAQRAIEERQQRILSGAFVQAEPEDIEVRRRIS